MGKSAKPQQGCLLIGNNRYEAHGSINSGLPRQFTRCLSYESAQTSLLMRASRGRVDSIPTTQPITTFVRISLAMDGHFPRASRRRPIIPDRLCFALSTRTNRVRARRFILSVGKKKARASYLRIGVFGSKQRAEQPLIDSLNRWWIDEFTGEEKKAILRSRCKCANGNRWRGS